MLEDHFALLDEPRRPWVDPQAIQAKFLAISADFHPDRVHHEAAAQIADAHQRFISLNAAWHCLRDTKERLHHLLELERGSPPEALERLPASSSDFYFELGRMCRQADQFLAQKSSAASPLLKVRLFHEAIEWSARLQPFLARIESRQRKLDSQLQKLNPAWDAAPPCGTPARPKALPLDDLEQVYREWSYLARWASQIRERLVQLSL